MKTRGSSPATAKPSSVVVGTVVAAASAVLEAMVKVGILQLVADRALYQEVHSIYLTPILLLCLQLLSVFLPLRLALHHLSQYKCRDALNYLSKLPQEQLNSPGVLLLMGRCLYELVDYRRAAEAFEAARAADPMNLEVS